MKKIIGILIIISGLNLAAQELLTNEGFELWTVNGPSGPPDNWIVDSTSSFSATQESTEVHGGSYSTNLTWSTTSNRDLQQVDIPVAASTSYEFSAWILDNDTSGQVAIYIRWEDASGNYIVNSTFVYSEDNPDWQQLSTGMSISPANAVFCEVRIRCYDTLEWDGEATVYIDDASLTQSSGEPAIVQAWCVDLVSVDVLYNIAPGSVDAADYQLSGTEIITFATATIDGTDDKLVHLTDASAWMDDDNILDTITDATRSEYEFYAGILSVSYTNTLNPDGTILDNTTATLEGSVFAKGTNKVWIHDNPGIYNGVLIYDYDLGSAVNIGEKIKFYATRAEYYNLTELQNAVLIGSPTSGYTYNANSIPGSNIAESILANNNPAERWESQLVKINDCMIVNELRNEYRATDDDGANYFLIDDEIYPDLSLVPDNYYNLTGVVTFTYDHYRLLPRGEYDIELISDDTPPSIVDVMAANESTVLVEFSEPVDEVTAETVENYSITPQRDVVITVAVRSGAEPEKVTLTVSGMTPADYTLTVENVEDYYDNTITSESFNFSYAPPQDWTVIINELDADTYQLDTMEFIELYDGGSGDTSLNGLALVLYNGSTDASYYVFDLDGYTTDAGGYLVLGNAAVPGVDLVFADNLLQNGADAVALYEADAEDFPTDTPVTAENLIDAIVYDTNDADDGGLISVLLNAGQPQVNEHGNGNGDLRSNQRIPNGSGGARNTITYNQYMPTPDAVNQENEQLPPPQNVVISRDGDNVVLSWDGIIGATLYRIYSDTDPDGGFSTLEETLTGTPPATTWSESLPDGIKKFYRITSEY